MKQKLYTLAFVWAGFLAFAGRAAEPIALMPQSIKNIQPTATIPSVQPLGVPRLIANDGTAASEENDKALLGLAKKFGATVPLTHQELAEIAGTTHETATRTRNRFKQQGLIHSSRGKTTLVRPEQLQALLK